MIKITKPLNLNGGELLQELAIAGIVVKDFPLLDGNNELWIDIDQKDFTKTDEISKNHNGTQITVK